MLTVSTAIGSPLESNSDAYLALLLSVHIWIPHFQNPARTELLPANQVERLPGTTCESDVRFTEASRTRMGVPISHELASLRRPIHPPRPRDTVGRILASKRKTPVVLDKFFGRGGGRLDRNEPPAPKAENSPAILRPGEWTCLGEVCLIHLLPDQRSFKSEVQR